MARDARGPAKRQAMIEAACTVFGRDGYVRGSIEAIAAEASVSTRTIYNHFKDKKELFLTMILDSAARVREAQIADIDRHLGAIDNLEESLCALGRSFAETPFKFGSHFAVVRQIHAEAAHLPSDILEAWRSEGPLAVHDALSKSLAQLSQRGQLAIPNPSRAANQFVALVSAEVQASSLGGALAIESVFLHEVVADGVKTFLCAYQPADTERY